MFAFAFAFPFPSHCVKVFQMLISQQSLLTEASNLELRYLGGSSEIPRELTPGFMPLGGARGQNLGHLCNTVLKFFKFLYLDFHSS